MCMCSTLAHTCTCIYTCMLIHVHVYAVHVHVSQVLQVTCIAKQESSPSPSRSPPFKSADQYCNYMLVFALIKLSIQTYLSLALRRLTLSQPPPPSTNHQSSLSLYTMSYLKKNTISIRQLDNSHIHLIVQVIHIASYIHLKK